ncbi:hypothetical protein [Rosenbergiella epipactidis]|uniref:hypothetical protein n=1 Tax=Rosenbergiella epipactidis TaxID=1544694 RepID=UPI001F5024C9|nr:hypothetical protein [Rosenbergiella epipactidis]
MSIVTAEEKLPQLRVLPVRGGQVPTLYCYTLMVYGKWIPIHHSFAEWIVGEFNQMAKEGANGKRIH